jgi:molybdate transport system substrate-binding protein
MRSAKPHFLAALAFGPLLGACRESGGDVQPKLALSTAASASSAAPLAKAPIRSELVVLAAASLKRAFEALEDDFESKWKGADVRFAFAGTQELRRQLEAGAKADVFASADEKHMQALLEQNLVEAPLVFTENLPVLVTYAQSRTSVTTLEELPRAERVVLGAPEVPIGRYSLQILERAEVAFGGDFKARVERRVVSRELNVRQVLGKVTLGEADAAIVYRSDVVPPDRNVRVVDIPARLNVVARYPIAVVKTSSQMSLAEAWVAFLRSPIGRATLESAGFQSVSGN